MDRYLEFVAARARPNTVLAAGYDLKVFFETVGKDPLEVTTADILEFISVQRGDGRVVRISDGGSGLSPRTIQRRLSTLSFSFRRCHRHMHMEEPCQPPRSAAWH